MILDITKISTEDDDFQNKLNKLLAWDSVLDDSVTKTVSEIIDNVKQSGDQAVLEYTHRFDRLSAENIKALKINKNELEQAFNALPNEQKTALETAKNRIESYAKKQTMQSWSYQEDNGNVLGQQVTPLDKVGLYVPGGKAAYPSSVLMNAVPAKVAGVELIVMVVQIGRASCRERV